MAKQRGRKTTNSLFTADPDANAIKFHQSSSVLVEQKLTVKNGAGSFQVKLAAGDTPQTVAFDALASVVQSKLELLESVGAGHVNCTGGALNTAPVQIEFTTLQNPFDSNALKPPLLTLNPPGAAKVDKKSTTSPFTWTWHYTDTFKDANSGRIVMLVDSMTLIVNEHGKWELAYVPRVFSRMHKWVYKLRAFDTDDQELLRLVLSPKAHTPSMFRDAAQERTPDTARQKGRSRDAGVEFQKIAYWTRVGVGEYVD